MIPWHQPHYWGKEKEYVNAALDSTWISDGTFIQDFEKNLCQVLNAQNCISTSNGTTALQAAFLALDIGLGDEVIVPGFTFAAPANMALALGAKPVIADVDSETWCLCPKSVAQKISDKTKAIVPVHIYGNACNMKEVMALAEKHGIYVVEDVAEAMFTKYDDTYLGNFGDFGCFSFQATKTVTTGEGGAVVTASDNLADKARLYRNHGMRPQRRYFHEVIGHNFRLTNLQAAFGCAQLEFTQDIIQNKKRVYNTYIKHLEGQAGIRLQKIEDNTDAVIWAIAFEIDTEVFGKTRCEIVAEMKQAGIETRPGFESFSDMSIYNSDVLPVSQHLCENIISVPSYAMLTDDEIIEVCRILLSLRTEQTQQAIGE